MSTSHDAGDNAARSTHSGPQPGMGRVKEITSTANPIVKDIKALALKKHRDERGLFLAEGLKLVTDALASGWKINGRLSMQKTWRVNRHFRQVAAKCRAGGADILEVNEKVLAAISRRDNPQTVMGVFHQAWRALTNWRNCLCKSG